MIEKWICKECSGGNPCRISIKYGGTDTDLRLHPDIQKHCLICGYLGIMKERAKFVLEKPVKKC